MTPWYDTHVHLDRYPEPERDDLLRRADEAGVSVLAVATDIESSRLVAKMPGVAGRVVGVHPRSASSGWESELLTLARTEGVHGVGECGFDSEGPLPAVQTATFRNQCRIARECRLALVLHIAGAGAWEQLVANEGVLAGLRVVRHYFTGDAAEAEWHRARGHFLSFGNPLRRVEALREIARRYPPELLLIETDSYPVAGRYTQPAHATLIGETVALLRGWTFDEARVRLAENTRRAFGLADED